MSSTPPGARDSIPPALIGLSPRAADPDDCVMFFCMEDAPRQACRTVSTVGGGLSFLTELTAEVISVGRDALRLHGDPREGAHEVVVRYLLPGVVDLSPLARQTVRLVLEQRYRGAGRATVRAELWDPRGRLLLLAWDGRMPRDGELPGLSLRLSLDAASEPRLALVGERALSSVAAPGHTRVEIDGAPFEAVALRAGADDLSLLLVRR